MAIGIFGGCSQKRNSYVSLPGMATCRVDVISDSTPSSDLDNRPDANPRHVKAVRETLAKEKGRYFDDVYGNNVVWLELIATRPDCQRRGLARSLCEWGMNVVKKEKIPLCVFSTEAGVALYDALRFEKLGLVVVNLEGEEEEEVRITPMIRSEGKKGEGC